MEGKLVSTGTPRQSQPSGAPSKSISAVATTAANRAKDSRALWGALDDLL